MPINDRQQAQLKLLGENLKMLWEVRNLSLRDLAYKIDKEPQSISRVENGVTNPTYLYLLDLCRGLEIEFNCSANGFEFLCPYTILTRQFRRYNTHQRMRAFNPEISI